MEIRGKTISYASFLKKKENKEEEKLLKDIQQLQSEPIIDHDALMAKNQTLEDFRSKKWKRLNCVVKLSGLMKGRKSLNTFAT